VTGFAPCQGAHQTGVFTEKSLINASSVEVVRNVKYVSITKGIVGR
jgi:hypothetical protein